MDGMIQGGWGYVWAAYGITWVVVLGYAVQLVLKVRPGAAPPGAGALADADAGSDSAASAASASSGS